MMFLHFLTFLNALLAQFILNCRYCIYKYSAV